MTSTRLPPAPRGSARKTSTVDATGRFRARARASRMLRLRPLLWAGGVLAVLVAAVWLLVASPWLRVGTVVVTGTTRLDAAQAQAAAQTAVGQPMARVDVSALATEIRHLPPVADVTIRRSWPSTLRVQVTERRPVAVLRQASAPLRLVDAAGVAFAEVATPPAGLPVLEAAMAPAASASARTAAVAAAAKVAGELPSDLRAQVTKVSAVSADDVRLSLAGATVLWGDDSASARKAQVLRVLLHATRAHTYDVSAPGAPTTQQ